MIKEVKINPTISYEKLSGLIRRADDIEKINIAEKWLKANKVISTEQAKALARSLNNMKDAEARWRISKEFIEGFYQWIDDEKTMPDREYAKKYGCGKGEIQHEDNFKGVKVYLEFIFNGRWLKDWEKAGYDKHVIWRLKDKGFLRLKEYSNWMARQLRETDFYYIPQSSAREIYRAFKQKLFPEVR